MPDSAGRARRLTPIGVERLRYSAKKGEAGPGSRMVLRDSEVPGLQLRISSNEIKTFSVYFRALSNRIAKNGARLKGPQRRITLGQYPALSLADARRQANEILGQVLEGRDPWLDRRNANEHRYTNLFESVASQFVARKKREIKSWAKIETAFAHHVAPKWRGRPITDLARSDVRELIDGINGRGTAREVRKHLHALFEWAVTEEIVEKNPLRELKTRGRKAKDRLARNKDAGRSLDRTEIRAAWLAAEKLGYPFGPWFQLLMLTGQRRSEWAGAKYSEIKPESELEQEDVRNAPGASERYVLEIPPSRFKSERAHIVPLSPLAWEIISGLPRWSGRDHYLFSGSAGRTPISGYSKAKARLDAQMLAMLKRDDPTASLTSFRIHDFRVSCRTRLSYLGIETSIAEAVIGHAQGQLNEIYNKHDFIAQKRMALEKYAEWLGHVVK